MFILFEKIGLVHPTACVYHFIGDNIEENTDISHFWFPGLGVCVEIKFYVAHIFYERTMSHNT